MKTIESQTALTRSTGIGEAAAIRGTEERKEKREGERRERKRDGGSCLCQNRAEVREGETEEEKERDGERERGVRTNRNVLLARLETAL